MSLLPPSPASPRFQVNPAALSHPRPSGRWLIPFVVLALVGCTAPRGKPVRTEALAGGVTAAAAASAARDMPARPGEFLARDRSVPAATGIPVAAADRMRVELLDRRLSLSLVAATLREVFAALSGASDLQFAFDPDLDISTRLDLRAEDRRVGEVLQLLARTRGFEYRFLFRDWVLVYPATEAKRREYAGTTTHSVRLLHADPKLAPALLSQIAGLTDIFVDEASSLVVMSGTPEAVILGERLLAGIDLVQPEVLVELEVFEVGSGHLRDLGIDPPESVVFGSTSGAAAGGALSPGVVPVDGGGLHALLPNPALLLRLRSEEEAVRLLASPRLRVSNRGKGVLQVGSKLPVFTTTASAKVGLSTAVSYLDVGVKFEVEPTVLAGGEIDLRIEVEFSDLAGERRGPSGEIGYQLRTQRAVSALRLQDGESRLLVGAQEERAVGRDGGVFGEQGSNRGGFSTVARAERGRTTRLILVTPRLLVAPRPGGALLAGVQAGTQGRPGQGSLALDPGSPGGLALRHEGGATAAMAPVDPGLDMRTVATPTATLELPETARPGELVVARIELEGLAEATEGRLALVYDLGRLESVDGPTKPGSISRLVKPVDGRAQVQASFRVKPDASGTPAIVASGLRLLVRGEEYEFPLSASATLTIRN